MNRWILALAAAASLVAGDAAAQAAAAAPAGAARAAQADPDADRRLDPLQPDFNLAVLPTTLRVPATKWAFRLTHRFTRALGAGDFGNLVENLFGLDSSAVVGLEFRYGLRPGTQIGIHRTSGRTIQLFAQQNLLRERDGHGLGLDAIVALEGENNLREHRQGGFGAVLSRSVRDRATVYAAPFLVVNSNPGPGRREHSAFAGLGARVRVRPTVYVVAEASPRLAGYRPATTQVSFGIEKRAGGHLFQLNFSNGFGTTFGHLARGGVSGSDWYIGFNISRKFFR